MIFTTQVELLVQSRNVRERLDGEEPLQDIPERPSQEALLSQQADMLQEVQTSQNRMQGQSPQSQKGPALAATSSQQNPAGLCDNTQKCCPSTASGLASDHSGGDIDDLESSLVNAVNHGSTGVLPRAVSHDEQRQRHSQAVQLSETPRPGDPALHAAPDRLAADLGTSATDLQTSAALPLQEKEDEPAVVDAAASCVGKGASGVLLIDDSDDLDFELAQQIEDAVRAAKDTQHAQQAVHAQRDADSQVKGGSSSGTMQTDQTPTQRIDQHALRITLHPTGAAKHEVGAAGDAQAAAAVTSQQGNAQPSTFIGSSAFQDNDMVIDDDLAQLLDAASALRPAGPPDTALAGPGPASTFSSQCNSSKASSGPRPTSAISPPLPASRSSSPSLLHQAAPMRGTNPPGQADRAPAVPASAAQAPPTGGHQLSDMAYPTREADGDMLAPEPAGPADLAENHVRWPPMCCYHAFHSAGAL